MRPAQKYILIPEYRPLYAMQRCFGPTHGPLTKPCPTPIDVIGKLLLQSGDEKLTIYETKFDKNHNTLPPVLLTLSNYKMSYEEIAGLEGKDPPLEKTVKVPDKEPAVPEMVDQITPTVEEFTGQPMIPTVEEGPIDVVKSDVPIMMDREQEFNPEPAVSEGSEDSVVESDEEETAEENTTADEQESPKTEDQDNESITVSEEYTEDQNVTITSYSNKPHMTKAERRRAAREAAMKAQTEQK